jgi:hypothetical protein
MDHLSSSNAEGQKGQELVLKKGKVSWWAIMPLIPLFSHVRSFKSRMILCSTIFCCQQSYTAMLFVTPSRNQNIGHVFQNTTISTDPLPPTVSLVTFPDVVL